MNSNCIQLMNLVNELILQLNLINLKDRPLVVLTNRPLGTSRVSRQSVMQYYSVNYSVNCQINKFYVYVYVNQRIQKNELTQRRASANQWGKTMLKLRHSNRWAKFFTILPLFGAGWGAGSQNGTPKSKFLKYLISGPKNHHPV